MAVKSGCAQLVGYESFAPCGGRRGLCYLDMPIFEKSGTVKAEAQEAHEVWFVSSYGNTVLARVGPIFGISRCPPSRLGLDGIASSLETMFSGLNT